MKKIAILHNDDADGFGAAFATWYGLSVALPPDQERPEMKFTPVQYGQQPPFAELAEFAPDEVYILDFSYGREYLEALRVLYPHLLVIDHHKTAKKDLEGLDYCLFDTTRSGCALAWLTFCKDLPLPAILGYVEDRDLWKFELPESRAVNAYIATLPQGLEVWLQFSLEHAVVAGRSVVEFQNQQIKRRMKDVKVLRFGQSLITGDFYFHNETDVANIIGDVPCVNASENQSELGHALCDAYPDAPFSMTYCDRPDGKRSYSLRSRNGFDVSVVAKAFGGGGHPGAAGFALDAPGVI